MSSRIEYPKAAPGAYRAMFGVEKYIISGSHPRGMQRYSPVSSEHEIILGLL